MLGENGEAVLLVAITGSYVKYESELNPSHAGNEP